MMYRFCLQVFALAVLLCGSGCMAPRGSTVAMKRQDVEYIRSRTVREVTTAKPELKRELESAAGYAVFRNRALKVFPFGTRKGYGVIYDNATGKKVYRRTFGLDLGMGLGIKNYRTLRIYRTPAELQSAIAAGGGGGASAGAALRLGNAGPAVTVVAPFDSSGRVRTVSDNGISIDASVGGVLMWRDRKLQPDETAVP